MGAVLEGLGWNFMALQHLDMPADASENIDLNIRQAQLAVAEMGKGPVVLDYIMDKIKSEKTFSTHREVVALNRPASLKQ